MSEQKAAPAAAPGQGSNLLTRVAAALVLAPIVIACAYTGGWLWIALVTLATIGLFIEWQLVIGASREILATGAGTVALLIAGLALAVGRIESAVLILGLGLVAVVVLAPSHREWSGAGFFYAAAAQIASVLVRLDHVDGLVALILVLLVVWVTDIGGYFAGRGIGGPKLWPRVSPNKTWAGAIGGFAASLMVAGGFAAFGFGKTGPMLALGAALSSGAQRGVVRESAGYRD